MAKFLSTHRVPQDAVDHFTQNAWTTPYIYNPLYKAIPTFSRVLKTPTGEDYFFSKTINTPITIPHLVSLQLNEIKTPEDLAKGSSYNQTTISNTLLEPVPKNPDCIFLLALGHPGLDGHPATMHGGVLCAILDEMMGLCVMLHHTHVEEPRASIYTVTLDTTYRAPVPTPGDVLVKTWLTRRQGRKWWCRGQVCDKHGVVMTEAVGMWVEARQKETKL